tara:strand:+ start:413 stop:730 length:318 start_codon:yes stop_codon:yes gene_type:complete
VQLEHYQLLVMVETDSLPTSLELLPITLVVVEEEEKQPPHLLELLALVVLVAVEMENMAAEMMVKLEHTTQEEAGALLVNKEDTPIQQDLPCQHKLAMVDLALLY